MTRDEAARAVQAYLDRSYPPEHGHPRILLAEAATVERPYGWLFFYDTAEALTSGDPRRGLIGNGPLLVRREDGRIVAFSSFYSGESALAAYENDPDVFPVVD